MIDDLKTIVENAQLVARKMNNKQKSDKIGVAYLQYSNLLKTIAILNVVRKVCVELPEVKTNNPEGSSLFAMFKKQTTFELTCSMISTLEKRIDKAKSNISRELIGTPVPLDEESSRQILRDSSLNNDDIRGLCFRVKDFHVDKACRSMETEYRKMFDDQVEIIKGNNISLLTIDRLMDFVQNNIPLAFSKEKNIIITKLNEESKALKHKLVSKTDMDQSKKSDTEKKEEKIEIIVDKNVEEVEDKNEKEKIVSDPKEVAKYKLFASLREIYSMILSCRSNYSSEEDFEKYALTKLNECDGLQGSSIQEISDELEELRRDLMVDKELKLIIEEVESEYTEINDKYNTSEFEALTDFELRLYGKFLSIRRQENISDELRQELDYCIKMFEKVENQMKKYKLDFQLGYLTLEEYKHKGLELKKSFYAHTILYDALGLDSIKIETFVI